MKLTNLKTITFALLLFSAFQMTAQDAFSGKGDQKFHVGGIFQSNANGIVTSYDRGVGEKPFHRSGWSLFAERRRKDRSRI